METRETQEGKTREDYTRLAEKLLIESADALEKQADSLSIAASMAAQVYATLALSATTEQPAPKDRELARMWAKAEAENAVLHTQLTKQADISDSLLAVLKNAYNTLFGCSSEYTRLFADMRLCIEIAEKAQEAGK